VVRKTREDRIFEDVVRVVDNHRRVGAPELEIQKALQRTVEDSRVIVRAGALMGAPGGERSFVPQQDRPKDEQ
jgi:hypothetical protein